MPTKKPDTTDTPDDGLDKCANCGEDAVYVQAGGIPHAFCAVHKPDNVHRTVDAFRSSAAGEEHAARVKKEKEEKEAADAEDE